MAEAAPAVFDLAVIGGGVNGCGIARDAAGRGASVVLFEQNDLASGTSSSSTKLIHGGLRYLESYKFRLVSEALREREVLWKLAPHIVWPLRFVLPHHRDLRPKWMLRLGLGLYDTLAGRRSLPGTRVLDLRTDPAGDPLRSDLEVGFEYSDCWVEDSRLVVLNARDAADRGARILTRTKVTGADRTRDGWDLRAVSAPDAREHRVRARVLVNAAGPWVGRVLGDVTRGTTPVGVRLVKGSHIVVPSLFSHDRAYIFQNTDRRIVFAIPYEGRFTLIGTTDHDYFGDPAQVVASEEEITYLCAAVSEYLRVPVAREDVVWTFSGVRPLYDDGSSAAQEATRDYVLQVDAEDDRAPLLSVLGGKVTTYRRLAEAALERLRDHLPAARRPSWTGSQPLPGGDFPQNGYGALVEETVGTYPFLERAHAARLVRAYGTRTERIMAGARSRADLGAGFGADLTEREVLYLMDQEWARNADDILWRRSKLGLRVGADDRARLEAFMAETAVGTERVLMSATAA